MRIPLHTTCFGYDKEAYISCFNADSGFEQLFKRPGK